jgi:hypothetical protein
MLGNKMIYKVKVVNVTFSKNTTIKKEFSQVGLEY